MAYSANLSPQAVCPRLFCGALRVWSRLLATYKYETGKDFLGELLLQGKNNLQAPWLGITAFLSVAILLSLLIFIGEAVRDAFDPNKAV